MKDAIGNDIVVGKSYGYTQISSGVIYILFGKVVKFTEKKVTLLITKQRHGVYGNVDEEEEISSKRSVYGCILFPI
jgi:hypothetical protein